MTKPPKYCNQVRIPAGSPCDCAVLNKTMRQQEMCVEMMSICGIPCSNCMFNKRNLRHWKQWKKETFKGTTFTITQE